MATLKQIRQDAGLSAEELAHLAGVSLATVSRVERNQPTRRLTVGKIVHALNAHTGGNLTIHDLDGVQLLEENEQPSAA